MFQAIRIYLFFFSKTNSTYLEMQEWLKIYFSSYIPLLNWGGSFSLEQNCLGIQRRIVY